MPLLLAGAYTMKQCMKKASSRKNLEDARMSRYFVII